MILYNKDGEPLEVTEKSINPSEVIKRFEDIDSDSTHLCIDSTIYTPEQIEAITEEFLKSIT